MFFDPIFAMVFLHFWQFHFRRDLMTHSGIETQWGWYKLWHEKHSILGNLQRQKTDTEMGNIVLPHLLLAVPLWCWI